jgi:hypothetical protein
MIFFILTNFHQPSLYFMYKWQTPKYHSKSYQFLGGLSLANAAIFCWILSGVFALGSELYPCSWQQFSCSLVECLFIVGYSRSWQKLYVVDVNLAMHNFDMLGSIRYCTFSHILCFKHFRSGGCRWDGCLPGAEL